MRLLLQETKKIWNPIIVMILIPFGLVYYVLFSSFYIDYFVNGSNAQADFDIASEWASEYGTTLDRTEYEKILLQLEDEKKEFDRMVKEVPEAGENGISSYTEFDAFQTDYYNTTGQDADPETERVIWRIIGSTNLYRIQSIENFIERYKSAENKTFSEQYPWAEATDSEIARVDELQQSEIPFGYIPTGILDQTFGLIQAFTVWVIISVVLLLSPTIVRDRLYKVQSTQYAAVTGRRILNVQIGATVLSALVLTLLNCLVYGTLMISKGALVFKDFYLYTPSYIPWVDWSYGTFLLVITAMEFLLALSSAILTVLLSRYSSNYIGMLLKAILFAAVLVFVFGVLVMTQPFFMLNPTVPELHEKGMEMWIVLGSLFFAGIMTLISAKFQGRKELL